MALIVNLRCVEYLTGKYDRVVRLNFRGSAFQSNVVTSAKRVAYFGQSFEWPIARAIEPDESINIQLFNYSKYLNNKLVGSFVLLLQQVIQEGELKLNENLVDLNNKVLEATINFEVRYHSPDGKIGNWSSSGLAFSYPLSDNISENNDDNESDSKILLHGLQDMSNGFDNSMDVFSDILPGEDTASQNLIMESMFPGRRVRPDIMELEMHKPKDFQVTVTIIEGQQLAGLDIDPVLKIDVGEEYRYTSIRQSSNCPYYNEYFVFNFHETPAMMFDKMISISAYHAYGIPGRRLLRAGNIVAGKRMIGSFKCDLGMVYVAPEHQFYHKWAVLLDPKDMEAGPKGYIKCDIAISGRGQTIKPPKGVKDNESDNIEGNLLLPAGVSKNRQRAVYSVCVFRGEDLPQTDVGILASVQKAFTSREVAFIDAFVQVSFVGLIGKTSVKKSYHPEWYEVLRFVDMFPPLCNRIKIQLVDEDAVSNDVVATHFIELSQIMDPGSSDGEGMLPTFGPSWINMYGAPRNFKLLPGDDNLNEGIGEGTAFRGRLLISITTTFEPGMMSGPSAVFKDKLQVGQIGDFPKRPFLLFATIFEASMIDRELKDKQIYFEISIGKYGNTLDGKAAKTLFHSSADNASDDSDDEEDGNGKKSLLMKHKAQKDEEAKLPCRSITQPMAMSMMDKTYGYLSINEEKPCLYVAGLFEDYRKRLLHGNLLGGIASKMSDGLDDVREMIKMKHAESHRRLKGVMHDLKLDCMRYRRHLEGVKAGVGAGRTKLDKHLLRACMAYIKKAGEVAEEIRKTTFKHNVQAKYNEAKDISRRIEHFSKDPQHALPDVILWMICDKQRVAYYRFPAKDLFHTTETDLVGKHCGKCQTIFLKKPGKKSHGQSGWMVQAKLNICLWLGEYNPMKNVKDYMEKLPPGYEPIYEDDDSSKLPMALTYQDTYIFQLRAYIFQARSLIGADSTGLSDPFARVIISNHCKSTQVIEETLCPTWDETIVIDNILLYGLKETLLSSPPLVIVEIYDYDKVGQPEFLGRVLASPKITLENEINLENEDESYCDVKLEWFDVYRGTFKAGQLLAAFQLLEGDGMGLPPLPPVKPTSGSKAPILSLPPQLKPTMSNYRLEVVFHGVRDLHRVQLMTVDHPRMAVECAGQIARSVAISDVEKNPNFETQVDFVDVELPDILVYWPPLIIRCIDSRSFGRNVLVGSATIDAIQDYLWTPPILIENQISVQNGSIPPLTAQQYLGQNNQQLTGATDNQGMTPSGALNITGVEVQVIIPGQKDSQSQSAVSPIVPDSNEGRKRGNKYRELISELDWWSKYYITKQEALTAYNENKAEPLTEEEQDQMYGNDESEDDDYNIGMIDYTSMDMSKVEKEVNEAKARQKALEDITDSSSKKKKKKKKKMKKMKKGFSKVKGAVNSAFSKIEDIDGEGDDGEGDLEEDENGHIVRIKYYPVELENVPEYDGFRKWFQTFKLYRGKKMDDEEEDANRMSGLFKGNFCIYKIDPDSVVERKEVISRGGRGDQTDDDKKETPKLKLTTGLPNHRPVEVRIIVYIIRCLDLHPVDFNGLADPYIVLRYGNEKIVDKDNRINNQLNPVFGRSFELDATFPQDSLLKVEIWDYDNLSSDDIIGETMIDLEDRYYSPHQARCGLQQSYEIYGYNVWRNPHKPSQILERLCNELHMDHPKYISDHVTIADQTIVADSADGEYVENEAGEKQLLIPNEHLALKVLKNWESIPGGCQLMPEHVETRTLFCDERPGVEQGKVEMWIDMFPKDSPMPTNIVDITPRLPKSYELRCIIWNTDEVTLDDTNVLTGERSSDIFVKGYVKGVGEDDQHTDVHYRSLTGEGNFNWRFVFRFDYLKAEEKIVFKKNMFLGMNEVEFKVPPNLNVQVWDADLVSADDFLGSVQLNLNKMVKPAKSAKNCSIKMLEKNGKVPTLNLFKNKRCKGWWPVLAREKGEEEGEDKEETLVLKGKVEAELQLLTLEEAEKSPAGLGREEPDKLPDPNRPDSSFLWIFNPLKTIRYVLWKNYKWYIITFLVIVCLVLLVCVFVYHLPDYMAQRIFFNA